MIKSSTTFRQCFSKKWDALSIDCYVTTCKLHYLSRLFSLSPATRRIAASIRQIQWNVSIVENNEMLHLDRCSACYQHVKLMCIRSQATFQIRLLRWRMTSCVSPRSICSTVTQSGRRRCLERRVPDAKQGGENSTALLFAQVTHIEDISGRAVNLVRWLCEAQANSL